MNALVDYTFQDSIGRGKKWRFTRLLISSNASCVLPLFRCCQYLKVKESILYRCLYFILNKKYNRLCSSLNVYLPIDTKIGKGCLFPHNFPLVINPEAIIGSNCIIHPCALIGRDRGKQGAPVIGNNCFIGHGSKIIGNPRIGDWRFISLGAIVTKDIPESSLVGAGVNNIISCLGKIHVELYLPKR